MHMGLLLQSDNLDYQFRPAQISLEEMMSHHDLTVILEACLKMRFSSQLDIKQVQTWISCRDLTINDRYEMGDADWSIWIWMSGMF